MQPQGHLSGAGGGTTENWQNEIGFFTIDNHMYWILKYEFYFGIINVVEVAEGIHVDQPINQKKCHKLSQIAVL